MAKRITIMIDDDLDKKTAYNSGSSNSKNKQCGKLFKGA